MPKYTPESVERVRDAIDMVDLVGAKTELRRSGQTRMEGLCPFHDERTPSFGIDPVQKVYHCFGCGVGGDAITFVMETEGLGFLDAIELLADRYGVELEPAEEDEEEAERRRRRARLYELLERTCTFYERVLWEGREGASAREYLLGRGLTEQALRTYRVGFAPSAWDTVLMASQRAGFRPQEIHAAGLAKRGRDEGRIYDMFRRRITFPLTDTRGRVIGFGARAMGDDQKPKYVNTPESELFQKRKQVYAAHLARASAAKAGSVLVVEGYTDVVALHQSGIENVVAIMGTSMTDEQVVALKRLAPVAHLALDADNAGQDAMLRAAQIAEREKLEMRIVPLPAGSDPAELVAAEGADAMRSLVETRSRLFTRFRVERALSLADVSSAEGKDRLLEELKPVFKLLPPSIQRSELVRLVADRLNLRDNDIDELLRQPQRNPEPAPRPPRRTPQPPPQGRPIGDARPGAAGRRPPSSQPASAPPPAPAPVDDDRPPIDESMYVPSEEDADHLAAPPRGAPVAARAPAPPANAVFARAEREERHFLAFCLALPDLGAKVLADVDLEEHFTSGLSRRAAEHLRTLLDAPRSGLDPADPELDALITELVIRSSAQPVTPDILEASHLQLELRRLERKMRAPLAPGETRTALAREREKVRAQFDIIIERANAN